MRRWPSRHPTNGKLILYKCVNVCYLTGKGIEMAGVVTLQYQLPPYPSNGTWTIRVEALDQIREQTFYVERYYITYFEVKDTTSRAFPIQFTN